MTWPERAGIALIGCLAVATAYLMILIGGLMVEEASAYTLGERAAAVTARADVGFPLAVRRAVATQQDNVQADTRARCARVSRLAFRCQVEVVVRGFERCVAAPLVRARRSRAGGGVVVFTRWRTRPVCLALTAASPVVDAAQGS